MQRTGDGVWFGQGSKDGSIFMAVIVGSQKVYPFSIWTYGRVEINFQNLMKSPFREEEKRRELLRRLNAIEGINISADRIALRPTFPLASILNEQRLEQFLDVMGWLAIDLRTDAAAPQQPNFYPAA